MELAGNLKNGWEIVSLRSINPPITLNCDCALSAVLDIYPGTVVQAIELGGILNSL